eukprot:751922-Hanusia_phi.AAC.4
MSSLTAASLSAMETLQIFFGQAKPGPSPDLDQKGKPRLSAPPIAQHCHTCQFVPKESAASDHSHGFLDCIKTRHSLGNFCLQCQSNEFKEQTVCQPVELINREAAVDTSL